MSEQRSEARFTGRHMAIIMVAFFGVVIAVNLVMARHAVSTFGGTVVDNSYVASQKFNGWLEQARAQDALGWKADFALDPARYAVVTLSAADAPIPGARLKGTALHPLGRADSIALSFRNLGNGRYRSNETLPEGRWKIHLSIASGADSARLVEDVQ